MHAARLEQQRERLIVSGSGNRSIYVIIGVLLLVLLIGSAVGGKSKSKPPPPKPLDNARAVLVSGGDGVDRTIVVPPCNAPPVSTEQDVSSGRPTTNSVALRLLEPDARVVLVPDCVKKSAGGAPPAAAFVLPAGSDTTASPALKVVAETQVLVPRDSRATTVIVPPCTGAAAKKDVVLSPGPGTTVATAQRC